MQIPRLWLDDKRLLAEKSLAAPEDRSWILWRRLAWLAYFAGSAADVITYLGVSPAVLVVGERNLLARTLGFGLPGALAAKLAGTALLFLAVVIFTRAGQPRWGVSLMIGFVALCCFFGAGVNLGWWLR